jgi:hypothetical protein
MDIIYQSQAMNESDAIWMARGLLRSSSLRAQEQRRALRKEWEPGKFLFPALTPSAPKRALAALG